MVGGLGGGVKSGGAGRTKATTRTPAGWVNTGRMPMPLAWVGDRYSLGMAENPFEILGLAARFDLSGAQIEAAYLARAAAVHPDLYGGDDAEAARASARLNDARRAVEDAERRANVLLAVLGGASKEQDKSLPPGFLMEMMEIRQEIEGAAGNEAEMTKWKAWAGEQRSGYMKRVGELFERGDLKAVRMELNAWRYIERLIEQV